MTDTKPFQIVDLFAGPGGLGEGFSALDQGRSFRVLVSAEMDSAAQGTLRLRAFFRALMRDNPDALEDYYKFCATEKAIKPWTERSEVQWHEADQEARLIKLGTEEGNKELDKILEASLKKKAPWVLIGGPPCQAYSLVGRSRNKGKVEYKPEEDHRHYLYKEYLRIIQKNKPAVFVMENVKGILSSKVGGELIFPQILQDLCDPDAALGLPATKMGKYKIISLVSDEVFQSGDDPSKVNLNKFTIKSEEFGIPQSRHRVILIGVSEKYADGVRQQRLLPAEPVSVEDCINRLPKIRSKISRGGDDDKKWASEVCHHIDELCEALIKTDAPSPKLLGEMLVAQRILHEDQGLNCGRNRLIRSGYKINKTMPLSDWFEDERLTVWLNHDSRKHMTADLRRYLYASIFASANKRSPKGHVEFDLPGLAPAHKNWKSGKFKDRFKVQLRGLPSSTVTSHISKDGHYFIHYDYTQCRSLTVREAARLQTFPDNYFFTGTRTEQYHQVGNAVPPLLAYKIAGIVKNIIVSSKVGKEYNEKHA